MANPAPVTKTNVAKAGAVGGGSAAAVAAVLVSFTPIWEGMDAVAKVDTIGTGHPVTYCYGQTDEFGKVKVGTRFTKAECDAKLAESLPKYITPVELCMAMPLPTKTEAALVDAAYNAGSGAVCKSPMAAKMRAGDLKAGCNAFEGWYIRSDGEIRTGLVARRSGRPGDVRKSEKALCLEGIAEGLPKFAPTVQPIPAPPVALPTAPAPAPKVSFWRKLFSFLSAVPWRH